MKLTLFTSLLLVSVPLYAAPSDQLIDQYNLAAEGDPSHVEPVYQTLHQQIESHGADPLSLVYLGSTQTLMGRDALMPWNKMKYTEQGLSTIAKGLRLQSANPQPLQEQLIRQGVPESVLTTAIAAATYTSLPDMFNHFERGYDLYLTLLSEPVFTQQPFAATAWIYFYAIKASLRANDIEHAQQWTRLMAVHNAENPYTQQAQALLAQAD
ncbi:MULTISPECIES: hypothetical protein [Vibrio]|uniref:Uncharacterized protein n=1 Tax=Vibrio proteolyticus NBRC 13287 TaxID=1219065 RepID=U3A3C8_VIBPR|nr:MULTISPECIES: hypothetical protein [Vibrio]NAX23473.1 hypothetical protein [Vibrio sp. V39_P1S14PM300]GAD68200.1 hypothetical protein VPR01S_12_00090 [Vibrio proteolyticus NBRC 13287]